MIIIIVQCSHYVYLAKYCTHRINSLSFAVNVLEMWTLGKEVRNTACGN